MVLKGKVSTVLSGGKMVTVTPFGGGIVSAPINVPYPFVGTLTVGVPVAYSMFGDNTGIIIDRLDGARVSAFAPDPPTSFLKRDQHILRVICQGLESTRRYGVHLYTVSRRKGNIWKGWRHPDNYTASYFQGKGYDRLAGRQYGESNELVYPDVPSWMPNHGRLQTEWTFTGTSSGSAEININLRTWLLPMLKPRELDSWSVCDLIGVGKNVRAPLLMQFRPVCLTDGVVGECANTLRVGVARVSTPEDIWLTTSIVSGGERLIEGLYASII